MRDFLFRARIFRNSSIIVNFVYSVTWGGGSVKSDGLCDVACSVVVL